MITKGLLEQSLFSCESMCERRKESFLKSTRRTFLALYIPQGIALDLHTAERRLIVTGIIIHFCELKHLKITLPQPNAPFAVPLPFERCLTANTHHTITFYANHSLPLDLIVCVHMAPTLWAMLIGDYGTLIVHKPFHR